VLRVRDHDHDPGLLALVRVHDPGLLALLPEGQQHDAEEEHGLRLVGVHDPGRLEQGGGQAGDHRYLPVDGL